VTERKKILLRLDPAVHDALARWAGDELRSTTAQIEFLLRQALLHGGRLPGDVGGMPRRGRPPKAEPADRPPDQSPEPDPGQDPDQESGQESEDPQDGPP